MSEETRTQPRAWTLLGEHGAHAVLGEQLPPFHRVRVVEAEPILDLVERLFRERNVNCDTAVSLGKRIHHELDDYGAYSRAMDELVGDGFTRSRSTRSKDQEVEDFLRAHGRLQ